MEKLYAVCLFSLIVWHLLDNLATCPYKVLDSQIHSVILDCIWHTKVELMQENIWGRWKYAVDPGFQRICFLKLRVNDLPNLYSFPPQRSSVRSWPPPRPPSAHSLIFPLKHCWTRGFIISVEQEGSVSLWNKSVQYLCGIRGFSLMLFGAPVESSTLVSAQWNRLPCFLSYWFLDMDKTCPTSTWYLLEVVAGSERGTPLQQVFREEKVVGILTSISDRRWHTVGRAHPTFSTPDSFCFFILFFEGMMMMLISRISSVRETSKTNELLTDANDTPKQQNYGWRVTGFLIFNHNLLLKLPHFSCHTPVIYRPASPAEGHQPTLAHHLALILIHTNILVTWAVRCLTDRK